MIFFCRKGVFFNWGGGQGGRGGGEGPGTDHVISGSMRGLKKIHPMAQLDRQADIATIWPSGSD